MILQMKRSGYTLSRVLAMYGVSKSRWYEWQQGIKPEPQGKRNFLTPLPEEIEAVLEFRKFHSGVGYRKFTYMLNDANIAYLPESTVFRILTCFSHAAREKSRLISQKEDSE